MVYVMLTTFLARLAALALLMMVRADARVEVALFENENCEFKTGTRRIGCTQLSACMQTHRHALKVDDGEAEANNAEQAAMLDLRGQAGRRLQLAQVNVALFDDEECQRRVGTRGPFTQSLCEPLSDDTAVLYRYDRSSRTALRRFHFDNIRCEDGSASQSSAMSFTLCTVTEDGRSEQLMEDNFHFMKSNSTAV